MILSRVSQTWHFSSVHEFSNIPPDSVLSNTSSKTFPEEMVSPLKTVTHQYRRCETVSDAPAANPPTREDNSSRSAPTAFSRVEAGEQIIPRGASKVEEVRGE